MSLAVLLFFSIASVKRDDYILPAIPGIAILCASVFTLKTRGGFPRLRDVLVVVFSLLGSICSSRSPVSLSGFRVTAIFFTLQSSDEAYYGVFQKNARLDVLCSRSAFLF